MLVFSLCLCTCLNEETKGVGCWNIALDGYITVLAYSGSPIG